MVGEQTMKTDRDPKTREQVQAGRKDPVPHGNVVTPSEQRDHCERNQRPEHKKGSNDHSESCPCGGRDGGRGNRRHRAPFGIDDGTRHVQRASRHGVPSLHSRSPRPRRAVRRQMGHRSLGRRIPVYNNERDPEPRDKPNSVILTEDLPCPPGVSP